jgi:hypothetical protein
MRPRLRVDLGHMIRSTTASPAIGELLSTGLDTGSCSQTCCFSVAWYKRLHDVPSPLVLLFANGGQLQWRKRKAFQMGVNGRRLTAHAHCKQLASEIAGTRVFLESLQL